MDNIIYGIEVTDLCSLYPVSKISQEAYDSYTKAVEFITTRSDNPERISDYEWKSEECRYNIIILNVV